MFSTFGLCAPQPQMQGATFSHDRRHPFRLHEAVYGQLWKPTVAQLVSPGHIVRLVAKIWVLQAVVGPESMEDHSGACCRCLTLRMR